jgi:hypothetical protein
MEEAAERREGHEHRQNGDGAKNSTDLPLRHAAKLHPKILAQLDAGARAPVAFGCQGPRRPAMCGELGWADTRPTSQPEFPHPSEHWPDIPIKAAGPQVGQDHSHGHDDHSKDRKNRDGGAGRTPVRLRQQIGRGRIQKETGGQSKENCQPLRGWQEPKGKNRSHHRCNCVGAKKRCLWSL